MVQSCQCILRGVLGKEGVPEQSGVGSGWLGELRRVQTLCFGYGGQVDIQERP